MSYADSLRQQAAWVREALDPATPDTQRITLDDIDVDELDAVADEIDSLRNELDTANNSHRSMAKLLADTGRERDELRKQLVIARGHIDALLGLELGSGERALAFLELTDDQRGEE